MFVDVYSTLLLITLLSLIILTLVDASLTVILIDRGVAKETNPIMAFYMSLGNGSFIVAKFLLTTVPVFLLCLCKDCSITKISLAAAIIIYLSIIAYEFSILYRFQ